MPVNPSAIVDNVAADLTTTGGLAPKKTKKYQEPVSFDLATDVPGLAVWAEDSDYTPLDTAGAYTRTHHLVVAWFEYSKATNNHGFDDPTVVQGLDATRELIVARVAAYSQGIPGFTPALLATLRSTAIVELEPAGMWKLTVAVDVDELA